MDEDNKNGAKSSKLFPKGEMTKSILEVGHDQRVYKSNLLTKIVRSLIILDFKNTSKVSPTYNHY